jgi:hypothetical protein
MRIISLVFVFLFTCASFSSFAQKRERLGYKFSNEEIKEMLLYKSKQEKTKGIVALIAGPVMTAFGLHLIKKNHFVIINGSSMSSGYNDGATVGYIISTTGIVTSLSSIAFFISSGRLKKRADRPSHGAQTNFLLRQ